MTRAQHTSTTVAPHRRNLIAIIISFLTLSFLYFNFDPTPAGADPESALSIAELTAMVPMPEIATEPRQETVKTEAGTQTSGVESKIVVGQIAEGRAALMLNLLLLEKGLHKFASFNDYTATFFKRERVDGHIGKGQIVNMKVRHAPFSVYMKWIVGDKGREVLYVEGERNGKMLVKKGGLSGRFLPPLQLDPNGSLAMRESRHPITKAGMINLLKEFIMHRQREVKLESGFQCVMQDNQEVNQRSCYGFVLEFSDKSVSEIYRKSIVYIDKELLVPIYIQNYTWPDSESESEIVDAQQLDEETIIEHYTFTNIKLNQDLADLDFKRENEKYSFRR